MAMHAMSFIPLLPNVILGDDSSFPLLLLLKKSKTSYFILLSPQTLSVPSFFQPRRCRTTTFHTFPSEHSSSSAAALLLLLLPCSSYCCCFSLTLTSLTPHTQPTNPSLFCRFPSLPTAPLSPPLPSLPRPSLGDRSCSAAAPQTLTTTSCYHPDATPPQSKKAEAPPSSFFSSLFILTCDEVAFLLRAYIKLTLSLILFLEGNRVATSDRDVELCGRSHTPLEPPLFLCFP